LWYESEGVKRSLAEWGSQGERKGFGICGGFGVVIFGSWPIRVLCAVIERFWCCYFWVMANMRVQKIQMCCTAYIGLG